MRPRGRALNSAADQGFRCLSDPQHRRNSFAGRQTKQKEASGLVSRVLSGATIYLERLSPDASSTQPECTAGHRMAFLFALAPDGVYQAALLPTRWCALTAPFQLFSCFVRSAGQNVSRRGVFFSVALSVESPRPAVSWHRALGSPDFPRTEVRGRLAHSPVVL